MIAELKFIKSSMRTETVEVTEIVKVIVMILVSEKWLFKVILSLAGAALTTAII